MQGMEWALTAGSELWHAGGVSGLRQGRGPATRTGVVGMGRVRRFGGRLDTCAPFTRCKTEDGITALNYVHFVSTSSTGVPRTRLRSPERGTDATPAALLLP